MDVARRWGAPAQRRCRGGRWSPRTNRSAPCSRAEVETGLKGIEVLALTAVKPTRSPEKTTGRIEVLGTPKRAPDVSVILAPGSGKRSRRRDEDGDDRDERRRACRHRATAPVAVVPVVTAPAL